MVMGLEHMTYECQVVSERARFLPYPGEEKAEGTLTAIFLCLSGGHRENGTRCFTKEHREQQLVAQRGCILSISGDIQYLAGQGPEQLSVTLRLALL